MGDFKQEWDLAMALAVLGNPDVDSATWAEAVKWLLFYGPPEIRELLSHASIIATNSQFPELSPAGYDEEGYPCYEIDDLAAAIGMDKEKLLGQMADWEEGSGQLPFLERTKTRKLH